MQALAFDDAERNLFGHHQWMVAKPEWLAPQGGTTALVALLHDKSMYVVNAGECKTVLAW